MRKLLERLRKKDKVRNIITIKKEKYEQLKSVRDILRPIYILRIIFGLRVFEYPRGHSRPILSLIYSTLLYIMFNMEWFYSDGQFYKNKTINLNETISIIIYIFNHIVIFIIISMGLYQSKEWKLLTKRLHEIDETLQALGSLSSFNYIYEITIRDIIIGILYLLLFFVLNILQWVFKDLPILKSLMENTPMLLYVIYSFTVKFILVIEFATILRCIKFEFQRVNELLTDVNVLPISSIALEYIEHKEVNGSLSIEQYLPINSDKLFTPIPLLHQTQSRLQIANHRIKKSRTLLRTIRQVHLQLYKVSEHISNTYGIQISLDIALSIALEIYSLYRLYAKYQEEIYNVYELILPVMLILVFILQYVVKIFVINYISDKTTKKAERINEILQTFYGLNTDIEIRKEVEIFSLQMMQCQPTYSTFGFYNLNCKHFCSCIGVITTYMIIMIQVNDSIKKGS